MTHPKDQTFVIPCQNCGDSFRLSLYDIRTDRTITCPCCQGSIDLNHDYYKVIRKIIEDSL